MLYFFSKKIFLEGEIRKTKRIFAFVLALFLVVTGIYLPEMQAKAETTQVETAITSIKYDVTVAGTTDETSFTWVSVDGNWEKTLLVF